MDRVEEPAARITLEAFKRLCVDELPFQRVFGAEVEAIGRGWARARLPASGQMLRPGGGAADAA